MISINWQIIKNLPVVFISFVKNDTLPFQDENILQINVRQSEEPRHKLEKKFMKIEENENFYFRKFPKMSASECCREVSFGYFCVRFSGIDRETCQKAHCAIKRKFFFPTYAWVSQIASQTNDEHTYIMTNSSGKTKNAYFKMIYRSFWNILR